MLSQHRYSTMQLLDGLLILHKPSILYCTADVQYNGRARSTLNSGRYLIVRKNDNSIAVHNGLCNKPCNYINRCTSSVIDGNTLVFSARGESICITIYEVITETDLSEWSEQKPIITRTEKELVAKLVSKWNSLIGIECSIQLEYQTIHGPIDILGIDINNTYHVVEVKRKVVTVSNCYQIRKYLECLDAVANMKHVGYLASPAISDKAKSVAESFGVRWVCIDFDE